MRTLSIVAISACLFLVLLAAQLDAQEKRNIRMVFVSLAWNSEIPFRAALARGYFKQQGLQIEPILIRGGPAAIAALVSGEVDYASIGGAQAIFRGKARGLDLSIIGCISSTTNYILLGNKQTRTVEELKGKPIGITGAGTYSEFAVKAFLKKNNLNPDKDVVLRAIGGTVLRAAAIEKGIIAAAPFSPEDAVRLMRSGYSVISNMKTKGSVQSSLHNFWSSRKGVIPWQRNSSDTKIFEATEGSLTYVRLCENSWAPTAVISICPISSKPMPTYAKFFRARRRCPNDICSRRLSMSQKGVAQLRCGKTVLAR